MSRTTLTKTEAGGLSKCGRYQFNSPPTFGSLFTGIGGIDLGLERAGFKCQWQVETDKFCNRILDRHWPDVAKWSDVCNVGRQELSHVDLIAGGFPCQDISNAGKRKGITGERSGLWLEFARIIREIRPAFVLVENVAALRARGLDVVLGHLAESGYDAEWECLPAATVGAPHIRDRIWLIAWDSALHVQPGRSAKQGRRAAMGGQKSPRLLANPNRVRQASCSEQEARRPNCVGSKGSTKRQTRRCGSTPPKYRSQAVPDRHRLEDRSPPDEGICFSEAARSRLRAFRDSCRRTHWQLEPSVGRLAHGVPDRLDRLHALGNAVVPQVAEFCGRLIRSAMRRAERQAK